MGLDNSGLSGSRINLSRLMTLLPFHVAFDYFIFLYYVYEKEGRVDMRCRIKKIHFATC